jgi:hypothetical protein
MSRRKCSVARIERMLIPLALLALAIVMVLVLLGCAPLSDNPRDTNDCKFQQFPGSYLKWTDNGREIWCRRTWNNPGAGFYD